MIRGLVVTVALLTIPALTACGDDGGYDDEVEASFLAQCERQAETQSFPDPTEFCVCTYQRIVDEVPYDDFTDADAAFSDFSAGVETTEPTLPEGVRTARVNCLVETQEGGGTTTTAADGTTTTAGA